MRFSFVIPLVVYIWFLTPNINTGDAGELITSAYFLGVAHPPGYPLYLMILKLFFFIPFSNIAFRAALVSALFGALTLFVISKIVLHITKESLVAYISAFSIMISYPFFNQAILAKFYTLNIFLIAVTIYVLILSLEAKTLIEKRRNWLIASFLLGLSSANHHTALFMLVPISLTIIIERQYLNITTCLTMLFSFGLGASPNIYILLRGTSDNFFNVVTANSIKEAIAVFLRHHYGDGNTLAVLKHSTQMFKGYLDTLPHLFNLLRKSFSVYAFFPFIVGIYAQFKINKKVGIILLVSLAMYGPYLAKLTVGKDPNEFSLYLTLHQYFLPAVCLFSITMGIGLSYLYHLLRPLGIRRLPYYISLALLCVLLISLLSRGIDSNLRYNYVPYQIAKDTLTTLPINSIFLSYGDNSIFSLWYLKLVGRYRDDICHLMSSGEDSAFWSYQGCPEKIYGELHPRVYEKKLNNIYNYLNNGSFSSNLPVTDKFVFKDKIQSKPFGIVHIYLPTPHYLRENGELVTFFRLTDDIRLLRLICPTVCRDLRTDDYFTRILCRVYISYLLRIAEQKSPENRFVVAEVLVRIHNPDDSENTVEKKVTIGEANAEIYKTILAIQESINNKLYYLR